MKPVHEMRTAEPEIRIENGHVETRFIAAIFVVTLVLALLTAVQCHGALSSVYPGQTLTPSLIYSIVLWVWWGGVAAAMLWSAQRWPRLFRFSALNGWDIPGHFGASVILGSVHLALLFGVVSFSSKRWLGWDPANYFYVNRFGLEVLIYGFVLGIVGLIVARSHAQQSALRSLELEKQLSQAQLKALQMQLEPHFLFNALNAVTTLVELGRNREASETLAHLNMILRSTLQRNAPEKIPFAQELQVVESYLAIQQVRFADRLRVKIEATPEALEGLVPCFLLQPIIENAIRHGIAPLEGDGILETSVERVGETLRMRVRDNGPGFSNGNGKKAPVDGYGIGMKNTKERLSLFYPGAYEFVAHEPADGGCEVTIQIPYERRIDG